MAVTTSPRVLSPGLAGLPFRSAAVDAWLRSYAQIVFSRRRLVGLGLVLITLTDPGLAAGGALGALVALATSRALGLHADAIDGGLYGYNAVLVGLTLGALYPASPTTWVWMAIGAALATVLTAALRSLAGALVSLPVLSLPFLLVAGLLLPAAGTLGLGAPTWQPAAGFLPAALSSWEPALTGFGALVLAPGPLAGALVLLGLLVYSRIGFLLAALGTLVVFVVHAALPMAPDPLSSSLLYMNGALAAVALGGVWFVPGPASFALGAAGALLSTIMGVGTLPLLARLGAPLLVLPFNLSVLAFLVALRQRTRDAGPKSVDFLVGSPEENLRFFRARLARFGARYAHRFEAPFLGSWVCTQAVGRGPTHQGPWRHAFDFEVATETGALFRGSGERLEDHPCYRLPVLAPADGTVVRVVDGVPDNRPGQVDLEHNWGNLVLLWHGAGLYSVLAHLSPGTLKVKEGEIVRRGQVLGACGASGRAPRPHLHFQLQAVPRIGAPTVEVELNDVVVERGDRPELVPTLVLEEGDVVRNLEPDDRLARALRLPYGHTTRWSSTGQGTNEETLRVDLDLYGQHVIRSLETGATLFFEPGARLFTVYDVTDGRESSLRLWQACVGRVPLERRDRLTWTDVLPPDFFRSRLYSAWFDAVAPFWPSKGVVMRYRLREAAEGFVVEGEAQEPPGRWQGLRTAAWLSPETGITAMEIHLGGRCFGARRTDVARTAPATCEGGSHVA